MRQKDSEMAEIWRPESAENRPESGLGRPESGLGRPKSGIPRLGSGNVRLGSLYLISLMLPEADFSHRDSSKHPRAVDDGASSR